jgi:hypothetical protein
MSLFKTELVDQREEEEREYDNNCAVEKKLPPVILLSKALQNATTLRRIT